MKVDSFSPLTAGPDGMYRGIVRDEATGLNITFLREYDLPRFSLKADGTIEKRNPDAHLGAEEKPYRPLVDIQHHGSNVHYSGKGQK